MTQTEIHDLLREQFPDAIGDLAADVLDPWIRVEAPRIAEVCGFLKSDERLAFEMLNDLTVVDYFEPDERKRDRFPFEPHLEVVYHLSSLRHRQQIKLKVHLPRWEDEATRSLPEIPSVSGVWAIADWHEREAFDLLGVRFSGHPNLRRILTSEDWVGHPLRKDYEFPLEYHGIRCK
jgi:NADH-quinone oxidoreductase subunit C